MGCACSRATKGSQEFKNEPRTPEKYKKISEFDEKNSLNAGLGTIGGASNSKTPDLESVVMVKQRRLNDNKSNSSLLRPFTNLFNRNNSSNLNLNDSVSINNNSSSCAGSSLNQNLASHSFNLNSSQNLKQSNANHLGPYSFLNLPIRTQYLLNSNDDIEKLQPDTDTNNLNNKKKINNEIKLYLSLSNDENLELISKHLNEIYVEDLSLFDYLRLYCAQHKQNICDLNLINLNHFSKSSDDSSELVLDNKYYRRFLTKVVLFDLFNLNLNLKRICLNTTSSFMSSFSLFVIYLSKAKFNLETNESLLCPDQIDLNDYLNVVEKNLLKFKKLELFNKYYVFDKTGNVYKLKIDFINSKSFEQDLSELFDFFSNLDYELNSSETNFALKYLKSIQQEEIELIINNADPQSIVWVHLNTECAIETNKLNKQRYLSVLNLLQTKILTNKYKQINSLNEFDSLNEFVLNTCKSVIDKYVFELNKNQSHLYGLRIDKQLSNEVYKHYEYYKHLTQQCYSNPSFYKLESLLNEYLNDKQNSFNYPLFILNNDLESSNYSTNRTNLAESNFCLNIFLSKWLNKIIENNSNNHHHHHYFHNGSSNHNNDYQQKPSILYRFTNHTILSSQLTTLLQNIIHHLCYLLEIHESCAFDSFENIIENISSGLESYFSASENERKEIVIIISNLNLILNTNHDLNLIKQFLNKIYNNSKTSNLKLVITISSIKYQNNCLSEFLNDFVEPKFKSFKSLSKINFDFATNLNNNKNEYLSIDVDLLFNKNHKLSCLSKYIYHILHETRYGIKQAELFDLIKCSSLSLELKDSLNHLFNLVWYTIKYYSSSIEYSNDNNQILYKMSNKLNSNCDKDLNELNDLIYSYYNRSLDHGKTRLVSYFNNRVFFELPKYYYLNSKRQQNDLLKEYFLNEFILNPKWIVNKSLICSNILYFIHDIIYFKILFHHGHELNESKDLRISMLESFLYSKLYQLNQDQNQLYLLTKLDSKNLENLLTNFEFINKSNQINNQPQLILFNQSEFELNLKQNLLDQCNKELVYFSKVLFLSKYYFLTITENQINEINIWKIVNNAKTKLVKVRTIKFNKTPRDLRLIDKHKAVVLIERNLHLIDLDKCVHLFDLNSTMNPNLALFEIHDSNHVVLLARNRLSVILMKVPTNQKLEECSKSFNTSNNDDMFLFKVGEDRYLNSLLVSKNGKFMVCGDEVQKPFPLLVWNLNQRKLVYDLRQAKHEFITSIQSISSSGKYVVSACQEEGESKNCLIVYDLTTGQLFKKLKAKENFVSVEISEESNVIIACLENSQLLIYDLENGSKKFTINSNRFPINKIKIFDSNKFKNLFITYDTHGYDWTIRLWDLSKGDQLLSSITCPSRILSVDINCSTSCFDNGESANDDKLVNNDDLDDDLFITASLYGINKLFVVKLDYYNNKDNILNNKLEKFSVYDEDDNHEAFPGLFKEIHL